MTVLSSADMKSWKFEKPVFSATPQWAVDKFGGKDYIFMHGYDKDENYASKLVIREITWTPDGWPTVKL